MIAILLATYNGERYLKDQIESLIQQSYKEWTLYIHDDGSTDQTTTIIKSYCDKYSNIYFYNDTESHRGAANSFLWLLDKVTADYYMFCDQDDIWLPTKIEETLRRMKSLEREYNNTPILVYSDLKVVDEHLNTISPSLWEYTKFIKLINQQDLISIHNIVTGCTIMINNQVKKRTFPVSPLMSMHDSWLTLITIKNKGIVSPITKQLILYRQHSRNALGAHKYNDSLIYRLKHIIKSIKTNYMNYKLVHSVLQISLIEYLKRKIKYYKLKSQN